MPKSLRRFALVFALAVAATPVSVTATDFGSNWPDPCDTSVHSQCKADNATHYVYFYGLTTPDLASRLTWAMANIYNPTDLSMSETSFVSGADVIAYDDYYGSNGYWAWSKCSTSATYGGSAASHTRWCKPQQLQFNKTYGSKWDSDSQLHYVACHELGHTVGLRHNNVETSCMKANDLSGYWYPNSHDISHINAAY